LNPLADPIVDGKDDGGGHGGSARRDVGGTPVKATAAQTNATPSIYRLQGS